MIEISKKQKELITLLAKSNSKDYNFKKSLEELAEYQEVIIKLLTKSKSNPKRPHESEAIAEFGDVILRGYIYLLSEFEDMDIDEFNSVINGYIINKLTKLNGYYEEKLYENGV